MRALAGACFAFIGYAAVSVAFALVAGADLAASDNLGLRTQGLFLAPLLLNFALLLAAHHAGVHRRVGRLGFFAAAFLGNAAAIALYQALALGGADVTYALVAPLLPAAIIAALSRAHRGGDPGASAPPDGVASSPAPTLGNAEAAPGGGHG